MNCLIIGYGNSLRSDDGAGQKIVEQVAEWQLPQVRSLVRHQLTSELAADIAQADLVIFVDAVATNPESPVTVQIEQLQPADKLNRLGHSSNPRSLLGITQAVYGKIIPAYWILIPAVNFDFGEEFSSVTQTGIDLALKQIEELIDQAP